MKRLYKFLLFLVVSMISLQLVAKYYFGLGALPLYIENKKYEYMYAPNQVVYRFGNLIITNGYGMRSPDPQSGDKVRILKIGDSVINGGAHVDNDNLSSTILTKALSKKFDKQITVYNISAQSWGPDNAFAYIKEHGNFGADIFLLVFSSHDLHDNMHFKKVVGVHNAWPNSQPWCALTDAGKRYAWPKIKSWFGYKTEEYDYLYDFDDTQINKGWQQFFDYCKQLNIPLLVYVHATLDELKAKQYDVYGNRLMNMLDSNHVEYMQGLETITNRDCYRDKIHLNTKGHKVLANAVQSMLEKHINALKKQ